MTTLVVEITREGDKLKMSAFEKSKGIDVTIKHYSECNIFSQQIKILCDSITHLFNKANRQHRQENDFVYELKKNGRALFDHLLTVEVKKVIQKSESKFLLLSIDEQLVQIPWELLFDGEEFLCIRFAMGRTVKTKQKISDNKLRGVNKPVKMLITADPIGDLDSAYKEGISIRNEMDKRKNKINVLSRTGDVSLDFIKKNIRDYDIVHFAGHAEYNTSNPSESGWLLKDGTFTSKDIVELGATASLPSIVFSNACQSGQTEEWEIEEGFEEKIYGLANAFLIAGVRHYIGTFWKVMDEPCYYFANEFYKNVIEGTPIGEAVRLARVQLINKYGYESIVWSSYMLYGDPSINLFFFSTIKKSLKESIFKNQIAIFSILLGSIIGTGVLGFALYSKYFKGLDVTANKSYVLKNTIAVMPFENLNRDKENDWLGYGFADVLSAKLGTLNNLIIIDQTKINRTLANLKLSDYIDKDTAIKVANLVGSDKIIIGSFQKVGENIRSTARLVNVKDGMIIGTAESVNVYNNLFQLQDTIALKIPELLNIIIGEEAKAKLIKFIPTNNISAYEFMAKSYQAYQKGDLKNAFTFCKQANQIDPNYWAPNIVLGMYYELSKDNKVAETYYRKALRIAKQQGNKIFILQSGQVYGKLLIKTKNDKVGRDILEESLEIAKGIGDLNSYSEILFSIAHSYMNEQEYEKAKETVLKCEEMFKDLGNKIGLISVYHMLGDYYYGKKDFVNAETNYKEAIRIVNITGQQKEKVSIFMKLGNCYSQMGRLDDAIMFLNESIFLAKKFKNLDSLAYGYTLLAIVYQQQGAYGNAELYYMKSNKIYGKLNKAMQYRASLYLLAYLYYGQLRFDKAAKYFEMLINKAKEDKDQLDVLKALNLLAPSYEKMGRYQDAIKIYEELLLFEDTMSKDQKYLIGIYIGLGSCYIKENNELSALEYLKKAKLLAEKCGDIETKEQIDELIAEINKHLNNNIL